MAINIKISANKRVYHVSHEGYKLYELALNLGADEATAIEFHSWADVAVLGEMFETETFIGEIE